MKFISTKVHGVLDYIVGIALIAAPYIFGFSAVGGAAVMVPQVLGVLLIIYSIFTKYELGLFKVIPMGVHLTIDFIASLFLALSPWIFGFANQAANVWVPHLVVGIVVIIVVLVSKTRSGMMMSSPMM